jgi:HEAT repeat protein
MPEPTTLKQRWSSLLKDLQSDDEKLWQHAGSELSHYRNKRLIKPLIKLISEGKHPLQKEMAAYALAWILPKGEEEFLVTKIFIKILLDKNEDANVRGQTAEGIGLILDCDKRKRAYKLAVPALLEALKDPESEVRFWSCYAVGMMNVKEAIPLLKKLVKDKEMIKGFWTVGEEASDVITAIETGVWSGRLPEK